jgi:hypothetical protein
MREAFHYGQIMSHQKTSDTHKLSVIGIAIFLGTMLSCTIDPGLEPTRSGFRGKIYFDNPWPEQTDQVVVVAATKFPPTSITEIVMSEPLPLFVDSTDYVIYTPPDNFAAVGLVWKEKNQPWDVTNVIGYYFPTENHWSPGSIEIKTRNSMVDSIILHADPAKAKRKVDSTIEGMLRVKGQWPTGAQSVLVAGLTALPSARSSLLDIVFSTPVSAKFDSAHYSMSIQPGTYQLVTALVIEENAAIGPQSIKGIYKKKSTDLFSPLSVASDTSHIKNIDITIDFSSALFPTQTNNDL